MGVVVTKFLSNPFGFSALKTVLRDSFSFLLLNWMVDI